jgi:hypothetical protein
MRNGINHVLATLPVEHLRGAGILVDPTWISGSKHAPIWAGYQI